MSVEMPGRRERFWPVTDLSEAQAFEAIEKLLDWWSARQWDSAGSSDCAGRFVVMASRAEIARAVMKLDPDARLRCAWNAKVEAAVIGLMIDAINCVEAQGAGQPSRKSGIEMLRRLCAEMDAQAEKGGYTRICFDAGAILSFWEAKAQNSRARKTYDALERIVRSSICRLATDEREIPAQVRALYAVREQVGVAEDVRAPAADSDILALLVVERTARVEGSGEYFHLVYYEEFPGDFAGALYRVGQVLRFRFDNVPMNRRTGSRLTSVIQRRTIELAGQEKGAYEAEREILRRGLQRSIADRKNVPKQSIIGLARITVANRKLLAGVSNVWERGAVLKEQRRELEEILRFWGRSRKPRKGVKWLLCRAKVREDFNKKGWMRIQPHEQSPWRLEQKKKKREENWSGPKRSTLPDGNAVGT